MGKWGGGREWEPEEAAEAVRLYRTGMSMNEVARRLNRDTSAVRVMFKRHPNLVEIRGAKSELRPDLERKRQAEAEAIAKVLA